MENIKIALVHDYLKEFGGAERVLEALHQIWPKAPIFTAFVDYSGLGPHAERIKKWDIRTSWVQKVWPVRKLHSPFRFLTPLIWESFNFDDYDVVITSSAWYIPRGIVTRPDTSHISYVHTPPRHLYGYETGREWRKHWPVRVYGNLINHYLRMYDYLAAQRVDFFIANSKETKRRIKKFYRRKAEVIYPPVEIKTQNAKRKTQNYSSKLKTKEKITDYGLRITDYYLCVSRLARAKHIDLAIQACNKLEEPLVVVGKGREEKYLRSIAGSTIKFLGEVPDSELSKVYAGAKALIFTAVDEEFGIVPVEAMAAGVPVIAYRSGGVEETVVEGKTGLFFNELSIDSLIEAIKQLNRSTRTKFGTRHGNRTAVPERSSAHGTAIKQSNCIKQAQKFSKERFNRKIKEYVYSSLAV